MDENEADKEPAAPRGRKRTLQAMRDGDIPDLNSTPAQIRHRLKKVVVKYFENLPKGEVGVLIVAPVTQQGSLIIEHTEPIPAGILPGMLEALQKQLPRDKRIAAPLEAYRKVQASVKSRGGE